MQFRFGFSELSMLHTAFCDLPGIFFQLFRFIVTGDDISFIVLHSPSQFALMFAQLACGIVSTLAFDYVADSVFTSLELHPAFPMHYTLSCTLLTSLMKNILVWLQRSFRQRDQANQCILGGRVSEIQSIKKK